jgi:sigma-E factor negative regulatory protein RseC
MAKIAFITHRGVVERITPASIEVGIRTEVFCGACRARGFCGLAGTPGKMLEIPNLGQAVAQGEEVNVSLRQRFGLWAVWWAYVLPLALVTAILVGCQQLHFSELSGGAAAVGAMAAYYGLLFRFKDRFKKKYVFEIEKINK